MLGGRAELRGLHLRPRRQPPAVARLRSGPRKSALFLLALSAPAAALQAAGPRAFVLLAFDRAALLRGQAWRLLSGHFVHVNGTHLLWNVAAAGLIGLAVAPALRLRPWLVAGLAVALGSSAGVLLLQPGVRVMAGLSGLLHGLLAAGAAAQVRQGERMGWLFLALLAAKIGAEQLAGAAPLAHGLLGGPIGVGAHALGAAIGVVAGLLLPVAGRREARPA